MKQFLECFEQIKQEYRAWWQRKNRYPLIYTYAHYPKLSDCISTPIENPEDLYLDADTIFKIRSLMFGKTEWFGVAFPCYAASPPAASFFGATPVFTPDTIWNHPFLKDGDSYDRVTFNANSPFWTKTRAMMTRLVDLADGHFFLSEDMGGALSLLGSLRGSEGLCLDLVDRPDEVEAKQHEILKSLRLQHDAIQSIIATRFEGSVAGCLPSWSPGRAGTLECDVSCLLSKEMFERFVVPEVMTHVEWYDHSLYHLCGPMAARHADALLKIPRLNGIQWQKGVNGGSTLSWLPLLKKIQKAGKLILVDGLPEDICRLCQELEPAGLFVGTATETAEESRDLIKNIRKRF